MSILGKRLEAFLQACAGTAYTEGPDSIVFHSAIAKSVWEKVKPFFLPLEDKTVLDVGCANGFAVEMFIAEGFKVTNVTGITCSQADANEAYERGLKNVVCWDMHVIRDTVDRREPGARLDLVWARHVMEHTPVPLYVLQDIHLILRPGTGKLYVEVPAPDTACRHTTNVNHYSCFERNGWEGLFDKAGFTPIMSFDVQVTVPAGEDRYYCWLLGLK